MVFAAIPCQPVLGILLALAFMGGEATLLSSAPGRWRDVMYERPTLAVLTVEHHGTSHDLQFVAEPKQPMRPFYGDPGDSPQRFPHLALVAIGTILLVVTLIGLASAVSRMK